VSRGLGRTQRFVLDVLAERQRDQPWNGWEYVRSIAGDRRHQEACSEDDHRWCEWDPPTPADVESVRRAVRTLERAGAVETRYVSLDTDPGLRSFLAARLVSVGETGERAQVSVDRRESFRLPQRLPGGSGGSA
jgi:hypothetical protein